MHGEIEPFRVFVRAEFLHNMNKEFEESYEPGTVFAVSSYEGDALTTQVLLDNGCVFSYVPLHALQQEPISRSNKLSLQDLVYRNCPQGRITVNAFEFLNGPVLAYFKNKEVWLNGTYRATIDWIDGNEQLHVIHLENGQYAALPNHKLKFKNNARVFPEYDKLKETWRI